MIFRSIIFYVILSLWTITMGAICLPFLFVSNSYIRKPINLWILGIFKLLEIICNITHEIRGRENIPEYSVLIASKHQSAFETFALFFYINKSIFIHKKQLFFIPIFGQYLKKTNMISINRSEGAASMRKILREAKSRMAAGCSIIIFPEGTRKKPGDPPDYKSGFVGIYNETKAKILPIAVNSGKCWPKHTWIKQPGHITIQLLKTIPSGLNRSEVLNKVEIIIENKTKEIN